MESKYTHQFVGVPCTEDEFNKLSLRYNGVAHIPRSDVLRLLAQAREEFTGGSSSYYVVNVTNPTTPELPPYVAECNDIIEALGMNYAEGNAFKAIWRSCAARQGRRKKGYDNGLYDAEKVEFFGKRMIEQAKQKGTPE